VKRHLCRIDQTCPLRCRRQSFLQTPLKQASVRPSRRLWTSIESRITTSSASYVRVEHASLDLAVPLHLYEQTIVAGLGEAIGK